MNGWFLAIIIIHVLNIGICLAKHDEEKTGKYNILTQLVASAMSLTIIYMAIKTGF